MDEIKDRQELLLEIEQLKLDNARLQLHHPEPREIAIRFDQPWEGNTSGYATVIRDGELFKMIYRGHRMTWASGKLLMSHSPVVCYAESRDGITWTKPTINLFRWLGRDRDKLPDPKANNIV